MKEIDRLIGKEKSMVEKYMQKLIDRNKDPFEVYGLVWEFLSRGGKRIRPVFCLLCTEAVGGKREDALPAAVCIELFHNFTLIHDDIEDNSKMRRGEPCLHISHGLPIAINAGDGLFMMAWKAVLELDVVPKVQLEVQRRLHHAFTMVLEGQAVELRWHRDKIWDIGEDDYLEMVKGKTGALIAGSCEVGSIIGGGSGGQTEGLYEFGMKIGMAFQIQDDILNITGSEKIYGKEIGGDIREGKRTLMVLHALNKASPGERRKMIEILDSCKGDKESVSWVVKIMKKYRSIEYAKRVETRMIEDAYKKLSLIRDCPAKRKLIRLAEYLVKRKI